MAGALQHGTDGSHAPRYQHCGKQHLHRYLAEFDFRYNNRVTLGVSDMERTAKAVRGIVGKRLTYRRSSNPA